MKGIIFAGCSFTWGQGLYFYSDLPRKILPLTDGPTDLSLVTHSQMRYKDSVRFPRTVATHFKTFEVVKHANSGCDDESIFFLNLLFDDVVYQNNNSFITNEKFKHDEIDYVVLQLTQPSRSFYWFEHHGKYMKVFLDGGIIDGSESLDMLYEHISENKIVWEQFYPNFMSQLTSRIKEKLIFLENKGIKIIIFSWPSEYIPYIKGDEWLSKKFMSINYDNKNFDSLEDLFNYDKTLTINGDLKKYNLNVYDFHPSLDCHNLIAKNIINKIENIEKQNGKT